MYRENVTLVRLDNMVKTRNWAIGHKTYGFKVNYGFTNLNDLGMFIAYLHRIGFMVKIIMEQMLLLNHISI